MSGPSALTGPKYGPGMMAVDVLPYERIDSERLVASIRLRQNERLLVLQPFGWHIDGRHIPNAAEHFSRESVCAEHRWEVICEFGEYVAVVMNVDIAKAEGSEARKGQDALTS